MSAFGTKKPGANVAVAMTFPEVFATEYEAAGDHEAYTNGPRLEVRELPAGHDLQADYHEQKKRDADRMAMAAVASRKSSDRHLLTYGTKNPFKAVLGQRKVAAAADGAAGFGGNLYVDTEMRGGGAMTGGVLRSAQGQRYGKQMLLNRIPQLNAISSAKSEWLSEAPVTAPFQTVDDNQAQQEQPVAELIELNLGVQQLEDSLSSGLAGITRFTLVDLASVLKILIRISSTSNREELEILDEKFQDLAGPLVDSLQDEIDEAGVTQEVTNVPVAQSVINYTKKMAQYVKEMLGVVTKSLKDRQAFSKALVKRLGLTRVNTTKGPAEAGPPEMLRPRLPAPGERPAEPRPQQDRDDDGLDDEDDDDDRPVIRPRIVAGEDSEEGETSTDRSTNDSSTEVTESTASTSIDDRGAQILGDPIEGPQMNVKALKFYYKTLTGKTSYIHNRLALLKAIYKARREKGFSYEGAMEEIPVAVQHSAIRGADVKGKLLFGSQPAKAAFLRAYPEFSANKTYPLSELFPAVRDFVRAYEDQYIGAGRSGGGRSGGGRSGGRSARVAPMTDEFNVPATSAVEQEQQEALRQAGLNNVFYTRDGRQTFGYRSGAYLGEELPPSGPRDPVLETKRQFNEMKETPMGEAKMREAPNPRFNDISQQFSPEQLAALSGKQPVGEGRARKPVGRKPKAFAKTLGFGGSSTGFKMDKADRKIITDRIAALEAEYDRLAEDYKASKGVGARGPTGIRGSEALNEATQRISDRMASISEDLALLDKRLARGYGRATGGIMRGQNLEKTGFPDSAKVTVENGFPARGGMTLPKTKPAMRKVLNQIRKQHPEMAAKVEGFLGHLKGQGRMVGAGWWDSLTSFVSSFFRKKAAEPPKAAEAPPGESTHGKTSPAESLSRIGIHSKSDFKKWAAKGGHPDKGGDTATFQKIANLATQMGWMSGSGKKGKMSWLDLLQRLAFKTAKDAIKKSAKGGSRGKRMMEEARKIGTKPPVDFRHGIRNFTEKGPYRSEREIIAEEAKKALEAEAARMPQALVPPRGKGRVLSLRQKLAEPAKDEEPKRSLLPGRTLAPKKPILPGRTLGSGSHGLTKESLPTDRDGYVKLAEELRAKGINIRVNSGSQLKSIRANFIKKLGL